VSTVALLASRQIRVSVDVVLVTATVVDSRGRPVEGLTPADFDVTVARRQSPVLTVEYVSLSPQPSHVAGISESPDDRPGATDRPHGRSRSIVFLLDDLSFRPEPARELGLALERLLPLLGDNDVVGLTTTSCLGPSVTPTVERSPILAALSRLAGRRELTSAPFVIGIDEALGSETRSASNGMVRRECELLPLGGSCGSMVMAAARREASAAVRRTEDQVKAIAATIE